MRGYDPAWNTLSYQQNRIYYTNVPYGDYRLEIQVSADNGDTWQEPARSLSIEIIPPVWLRWWAKLSYAAIALFIIGMILYQYNKEQHLRRENQFQELLRKKDEEKYQSTLLFFMNLSHELKTPLSLILLAIEQMGSIGDFRKEVGLIRSNAKKMLQLIIEMIDLRKTDMGINELVVSHRDIQCMAHQIFQEIVYLAEKKQIKMRYTPSTETLLMDMDPDKIGKMIINIYSNAIKYTAKGETIEIELKTGCITQFTPRYKHTYSEGKLSGGEEACLLVVRDSGVGISAESISHIYERFFQVKGEAGSHLGSGIGLAIVKNTVLLHKGMILVSSERGVGTEIVVALPLRQANAKQEKHATSFDAKAFMENQYADYPVTENNTGQEALPEEIHPERPILLIVEDNKEMQAVLKDYFAPHYNVRIADNGCEGLTACEEIMPDIIVSDVMMPEMDGIEMCRHIRDNLSIAYLPIILLTAKAEVEDQIEGYESGADLYIPKPFSMKLLAVNIKQLLEKKRQIFKPLTSTTATRQTLLDDEKEQFKMQLRQLIEDNFSNPDLSVDFFCQQLFMGKTKLWQKVKDCCGESLAEYVRNIRLEKAASLLRESTFNIGEIKYEVGYTNSSHFARSFKQKFGVSPSDYAKDETLPG